jgi:O-antigen/teichoic acid export membrane protein
VEYSVALTDTNHANSRLSVRSALARARGWLNDRSHSSLAQRMAGAAFLVRVVSAALIYLTQVLLARWMGSYEFGIYVYVWTWVLLIGGLFDFGLAQSAQRFIPEYTERKRRDLLRGFLSGSRWLAAGVSTGVALFAIATVYGLSNWLDHYLVVPLFLACLCLPMYALAGVQDGIGRSYNWLMVGLAPPYILRPLLLILIMAGAYAAGYPVTAVTAMVAAVGATWLTALIQLLLLNRQLAIEVERGPKTYEVKGWLATSLPILLVESFYLMLTYTDVLVLKHFRSPEEIAVYYAAAKTLALVAFVNFSVSAAVAHRFTEYHVSGDRERLSTFLRDSIKWTFWPSLAATALVLMLGRPFLWLFGPEFSSGYPIMFVLAIGLLARAAVGPVERLLNMLGEQNICAAVYAAAFFLNLGGCVLLIPTLGGLGAAIATSFALVAESILLFLVTRKRLGLHVFIWPARASTSGEAP